MWLVFDSSPALLCAIMSGLLAIPLAMTFSCHEPQPRRWMTIYTASIAALGVFGLSVMLLADLLQPETLASAFGRAENFERLLPTAQKCLMLFNWGCILSVWAVNIAKSTSWKR